MNTKFISIVVLVIVIVAVIGLVIFRDLKTAQAPESTNLGSETPSEPPAPNPEPNKVNQNAAIPVPDLTRIVVGIDGNALPEATRAKNISDIKDLSKTLEGNHDYIQGWLQLGILRKFLGDYEGARDAWIYVSLVRPADYIAFSNLGDLYHYHLKNFPEAEKNLRKMVDLKPDNIAGWRNLADLYNYSYPGGETGKSKARAVLEEGLSKNPANAELKQYLSSL